jgi:transposase
MKTALAIGLLILSLLVWHLDKRVTELEEIVTKHLVQSNRLALQIETLASNQRTLIHTVATEIDPQILGAFFKWRVEKGE